MQESSNTTADRIGKGVAVTRSAIQSGDIKTLKECLALFAKLGATNQQIYEAVKEGPMSMGREANITIPIHSELLGYTITLGKDITWDEIAMLIKGGTDKGSLKIIMEAKKNFGGSITEVTSADGKPREAWIAPKDRLATPMEETTPPEGKNQDAAAPDESTKQDETDEEPGLFPGMATNA